MPAIRICQLSKRFGATQVLEQINLAIEPGELFFLLGPSGCGKTTLLRHIAGFCFPDTGSIWFGDEEVTRLPPHRRETAMMFQSYALWPHLSVAENVAFGLEERQRPRAEVAARVQEALASVRLEGLGERRIQQLSGGQQQRVALARALVVRPRCVLLDEPLSNLDARLRLEMRSEIRRICQQAGVTAIYVTHDQEEALTLADRLGVMAGGRLLQVGSPQAVYRTPVNRTVASFMGATNLLPGQIVALNDRSDRVEVATAAGVLRARLSTPEAPPAAGQPVWLSVRPEALRLTSTSADAHRLTGELMQAEFLGSTARYQLRLADGSPLDLIELNPAGRLRAIGEALTIEVSSDDLVVLTA